ncbi:MAG: UDP-N-acetylmuramoyl-L-alanine--D-glutamate ligase [Proteobacteria bacterium]|nr:UDP-N-acetylmuramoyl-L-alanine--D-glutamate ligase [Pseudomonadota bacterium]
MSTLANASVLVLGLGDSGLAMARWCLRCGAARVRVWDSRAHPPQAAALAELPGAERVAEPALEDATWVLKSPGLAPHEAAIAPLLAAAPRVAGELDLFALALADLAATGQAPQVVAITGTNGKTTTTALTGELVRAAGRRVAVAGNIGPTLLDTLTAALDGPEDARPEVWVLELSSFQLHGVQGFDPTAAVVLNITQDHLDWHGSLDAYAADKARIYGPHTAWVVNRDDARVLAMLPPPQEVRQRGRPTRLVPHPALRFGGDAPQAAGDFGIVDEAGMTWLVRALPDSEPGELTLQRLMPADALRIRGRHNASNALAALALAVAIGCPLAPMLHALRDYAGEPHRVQWLGQVAGVDVFDDSKGTNVGATVAALTGLGAERSGQRLVVILGGDGKGQDFTPLAAPLAAHAKAVALIGRDAEAIAAVLPPGLVVQRHATLEAAVAWAFTQAAEGDALLLSPACASMDMFKNYAHRAEVFVAAVAEVASERGEVFL